MSLLSEMQRTKRRRCYIETDATPVKCRGEKLAPIWWRGRQWAVTAYGIEALNGTYHIEFDRLTDDLDEESDFWWFCEHVARKPWVDTDDLATAWLVAMSLHGVHADPLLLRNAIAALPPATTGGAEACG